jgi:hypothetical protein
VSYTIDSFGGGGEFTLGWRMDEKSAVEWHFQGTKAGNVKRKPLSSFAAIFVPQVYNIPVIDGQSLGFRQQALSWQGGSNFRSKLEYDTWYIDTFAALSLLSLKTNDTKVNLVGGPAYAHFDQDFNFGMTAINAQNSLPGSTDLEENISDNLVGLKVGFRLSHKITKKFLVTSSIFGGGYYRWSKLDADQTLTNMNIPFADASTSLTASVDDRDNKLVPRFEGNLDISYMLSGQWGLGLSGGVGVWANMSKVENPEVVGVSTAAGTFINKPVHLGDDDTLIDYRAGLAITFRH